MHLIYPLRSRKQMAWVNYLYMQAGCVHGPWRDEIHMHGRSIWFTMLYQLLNSGWRGRLSGEEYDGVRLG